MSSLGQTTVTGLSARLDEEISHDKVTRFLSRDEFDSIALGKRVKKSVRGIESDEGVLLVDDTVQPKPHIDETAGVLAV